MTWIPERDGKGRFVLRVAPFGAKEDDGKKLFKRVHGEVKDCVIGDNVFELVVPYDLAKLNRIEIVGGEIGDTADFEVYDTPTGLISTVPNVMLNQFGFGVAVAPNYYDQYSEYDADVYKDMKLECHINSVSVKKIGVNFILNELK